MASEDVIEAEKLKVFKPLRTSGGMPVKTLKARLQRVMEYSVFVERDRPGLVQAISEISKIREEVREIGVPDFKRFNLEWIRAIDFPFMLEAAEIVAQGALLREESRGFHYRTDFPREDNEKWLCHTLLRKDSGTGEMKLSKAPVVMTKYRPPAHPGEDPIPI